MSRTHKDSMVLHAAKMLWRNRSSYALLSVTIVLSFSLLLGYLAFTDSDNYNRYKVIFSAPEDVFMAYSFDTSSPAHDALATQAKKLEPDIQLYQYFEQSIALPQYGLIHANATFLPQGNVPVYDTVMYSIDDLGISANYAQEVELVLGRFDLKINEAVINESFFYALNLEGTLPITIDLPIAWEDGDITFCPLEIVGVCKDTRNCTWLTSDEGELIGYVQLYLSQANLGSHKAEDLGLVRRVTWMSAKEPQALAPIARDLDMVVHSVSEAQLKAKENLMLQTATKGMLAIVLLLLLGVNLYSSFTNALNARKYEIGVKRAIGASGWRILQQFLLESVMVMLVNILVSILIVLEALVIYKLYQHAFQEVLWTIHISRYSIAIFLVCSVALTVLFSLIFSYKSTRVEIVEYLKGE